MKPARHEQGFTLVEIMVVLAIIGITLAISIPLARKSGKSVYLDADARYIMARLREGRELALLRRSSETVYLHVDDPAITGPAQRPRYVLTGTDKVIVTTARGLVEADTAAIVFHGDGGSTGGAVELRRGTLVQRIEVNWLTGVASREPRSNAP